jgi:hypothetical protein
VFDFIMSVGRENHSFPVKSRLLLTILACLFSIASYSQKIDNVDFAVDGNTVKVHYDIEGCSSEKNYDVRLLLGVDGKVTEIKRGLSGDVQGVSCGSGKTIRWDVLADLQELNGRIYFTVEVVRAFSIARASDPATEDWSEPQNQSRHSKRDNTWASESWKADKGYVGGSLGVFSPYQGRGYSLMPYNLTQGGFFMSATLGYLPTLLLGVSTTVYVYSQANTREFNVTSGKNLGFMIGPLISLPIGNRIKWELRPQLGYSAISVASDLLHPDSLNVVRAGMACNLGTGLRLNIGKRTCYMINVDYLSAPIRFDDLPIETERGTLSASFGVAFRFY